jgi:hypothetical protein
MALPGTRSADEPMFLQVKGLADPHRQFTDCATGTDLGLVSKMLGHSTVLLTCDTYAHLLEGIGTRAADAADALIPGRAAVTTV